MINEIELIRKKKNSLNLYLLNIVLRDFNHRKGNCNTCLLFKFQKLFRQRVRMYHISMEKATPSLKFILLNFLSIF